MDNSQRSSQPAPHGPRRRVPSRRASAVLAVAMLAIGVVVGAAVGPAPATSLAGDRDIVGELPALIAGAMARGTSAAPAEPPTTASQPPPSEPQPTPTARATSSIAATAPAQEGARTPKPSTAPERAASHAGSKLPPITSVWLIELSGSSFNEALANASAAPYITGELIAKGTFLAGWSALSAGTFAGEAALIEHATVGGTPPALRTIAQPPCPEGPTAATCLPGTPAGIAAADAFLANAVASITATTTYAEHGLIVVTYATVADPASVELPPASSATTLGSQPPAGAVLLSPFAKAGAKPTIAFDATSPVQSLERLLH